MQSELPRETYRIFPNVLGRGTVFTEYLEGSLPAKPTLGNPVQWVQWHPLYQTGRIGCGDMCKVPSRTGDQRSLGLFPHQRKQECHSGKSELKCIKEILGNSLGPCVLFRKAAVNGVKCQVYNFLAVWSGSGYLASLRNDARIKSDNLVLASYCIMNYPKTEWLNTHLLFHSFCW